MKRDPRMERALEVARLSVALDDPEGVNTLLYHLVEQCPASDLLAIMEAIAEAKLSPASLKILARAAEAQHETLVEVFGDEAVVGAVQERAKGAA